VIHIAGSYNKIHHLEGRQWIKTHRGLVKQHDSRPADQGAGNFEPTLHSAGKLFGKLFFFAVKPTNSNTSLTALSISSSDQWCSVSSVLINRQTCEE
jgi:hypothetical protein